MRFCSVEGCNNKHHAKGYCQKHHNQMKYHGHILEDKEKPSCQVEGCTNKHYAKGYCNKHYNQMRQFGEIIRTKYDSNEFIIHEDYAEMLLYDRKGNPINKTLIDLDCIEILKQYKWHMIGPYVSALINGSETLIHRFLMNPSDDMEVDHINRNKLDNRRNNLRICTHQENDWNKLTKSNNKSGYSGVKQKDNGKWIATLITNKKSKHLGTFDTYEEAVEARKKAEKEYFGDYAPNN